VVDRHADLENRDHGEIADARRVSKYGVGPLRSDDRQGAAETQEVMVGEPAADCNAIRFLKTVERWPLVWSPGVVDRRRQLVVVQATDAFEVGFTNAAHQNAGIVVG